MKPAEETWRFFLFLRFFQTLLCFALIVNSLQERKFLRLSQMNGLAIHRTLTREVNKMGAYQFARFIQETPAWVIVGSLTGFWALILLIHALLYSKYGSLRDWLSHVGWLIPFAILLDISVFAWQFVTQETGYWLLILVGTPFEAILGLWYYRKALAKGIKDQSEHFIRLLNLLWYAPIIVLLTGFGAYVFAKSSELTAGKVHPLVYLVLWVGLTILAIWVGKATRWYIDKSLYPMLEDWKQRRSEVETREQESQRQAEEAKKQKEYGARFKEEVIETAGSILEKNPQLGQEAIDQLPEDLDKLYTRLTFEDKQDVPRAIEALVHYYEKDYLPSYTIKSRRQKIIQAAAQKLISLRTYATEEDYERYIEELTQIADYLFEGVDYLTVPLDQLVKKLLEEYYQSRRYEYVRVGLA